MLRQHETISEPITASIRTVIELTNVDNLQNDDDVTVTTYRTLNRLIHDASGSWFVPGSTQTIDTRWGKEFIFKLHGKIKNGVLTTDPHDIVLPGNAVFQDTTVFLMRGAVLRLNLTPGRCARPDRRI